MTAVSFLLLAAVALAPLAWGLMRRAPVRGRRAADLALHRAQLDELDADIAAGRVSPHDQATAKLEVQRRLLAAAGSEEVDPGVGRRAPVLAALLLVPLAGLALYRLDGHPELPAAPLAVRIANGEVQSRQERQLLAALQTRLAQLDPRSEQARQGQVLLGDAEARWGNLAAAARAWQAALVVRPDPALDARLADARALLDEQAQAEVGMAGSR